jgi:hypothetical protein
MLRRTINYGTTLVPRANPDGVSPVAQT